MKMLWRGMIAVLNTMVRGSRKKETSEQRFDGREEASHEI